MGVAGTLIIPVSSVTDNAAFFPPSRLALWNKGSFSNACLFALAGQLLLPMLLVVRGMSLCHRSSPKAWQESPAGRGHREMLAVLLSGWQGSSLPRQRVDAAVLLVSVL